MTVKETLKEIYEGNNDLHDFEVWKYTDKTRRLHTDFIKNIDEEYGIDSFGNLEVKDYHIMNEKEYEQTICCNSDIRANFTEWYDDVNAKVLVIMLDYDVTLN